MFLDFFPYPLCRLPFIMFLALPNLKAWGMRIVHVFVQWMLKVKFLSVDILFRTKDLYFPTDTNSSLKTDIIFGQFWCTSSLGKHMETSGGQRGISKKLEHGNLNEAVFCLLGKEGTRTQTV